MEKIQTDVDSECKLVSSLEWWQNDGDFFLKKYVPTTFCLKPAVFELDEKMWKWMPKFF